MILKSEHKSTASAVANVSEKPPIKTKVVRRTSKFIRILSRDVSSSLVDVQHRRTHVEGLGTSGTHPAATIGRLRIQLSRALTIRRQFEIGRRQKRYVLHAISLRPDSASHRPLRLGMYKCQYRSLEHSWGRVP